MRKNPMNIMQLYAEKHLFSKELYDTKTLKQQK